MQRYSRRGMVLAAAALACCSTAPTEEERRAAEQRLIAPFIADREVGCGELVVAYTGNFHGSVSQPAIDRTRHAVDRREGEGFVETTWTNTAGAPDGAFIVTIGDPVSPTEVGDAGRPRTRFRVVNQLRLRVYEDRRPLTFEATAGGPFVYVKEGTAAPRQLAGRLTYTDGALRGL